MVLIMRMIRRKDKERKERKRKKGGSEGTESLILNHWQSRRGRRKFCKKR